MARPLRLLGLAALLAANSLINSGAQALPGSAPDHERRQETQPSGITSVFKADPAPGPSSTTLQCGPAPSGAFGGVAGCIPLTTADVAGSETTSTPDESLLVPPPPPETTTTAPLSTFTALPPGASLITLSSGQFTSDQYITTTLPGSSSETVVPVIVPTSGPPVPVICVGCPPSGVIILPPGGGGGGGGGSGLCFQLFGLKIGSCPPDSGNSGGDGDSDGPTPTPTDQRTSDSPSPTTEEQASTTEQSSCTVSITATYEGVFCKVVASDASVPNGKKARDAATGCTTQVYSTITACSAVGSTTTVTTTAVPTNPPCSADTCLSAGDSDTCSGSADDSTASRLFKKDVSAITKRTIPARNPEPDAGKVATPDNYAGGDQGRFMRGETGLLSLSSGLVPLVGGVATSKFILWADGQPASIGLSGLFGCTSLVIVSQQGAWVTHFWETPGFTMGPGAFKSGVTDAILNGRGDESHSFGLKQLRGGSQTKLGEVDIGKAFDDINNPQIFLMVPRKREDLSLPDVVRMSPTAGLQLGLAFPDQVGEIVKTLREIFNKPDLDPEQVQYSPMVATFAELEKAFNENTDLDPAVKARLRDDTFDTPRGKLLIQFQPGVVGSCTDKNEWRAYFEDQPLGNRKASWTRPETGSSSKRSESFLNAWFGWKRQVKARTESVCPLDPTGTVTASPTAAESLSSPVANTATDLPPDTTTSCLPGPTGAFGGVVGCIPGPTITQPPTSTATGSAPPPPPDTTTLCSSLTCQDGTCVCATAPTPTASLSCLGSDYSGGVGFARDDGVSWANDFCNQLSLSQSISSEADPKNPTLYDRNLDKITIGNSYVHLSLNSGSNGEFCAAGENFDDESANMDVAKCIGGFLTAIDSCAPLSLQQEGKPFVKYSAWNLGHCYNYSIEVREAAPGTVGIGRRGLVDVY